MDPRYLTGAARIGRTPILLRMDRHRVRKRYGVIQPLLSDKGFIELAGHEAIVLSPYYDSVHVLSWGMGHTRAAGAPDPASLWGKQGTIPQVVAVARTDLLRYQRGVDAAFTRPLTQAQKDAATNFHYNTGAIGTATWVRLFNAGNNTAARNAFMDWDKPASIIGRRTAECRLFFDGIYANTAGTATLVPASGSGVLEWSGAKTVAIAPWLTQRAA